MSLARFFLPVVLLAALLAGCVVPSAQERRAAAAGVAHQAGWQRLDLDAGAFVLAAFVPPGLSRADVLTVYIEGDGAAWVDAGTPAFDPTPRDPLALRLAIRDPRGKAVYLARPCQYVEGQARRGCSAGYWTARRFAPEVVAASDRAIAQLQARYGASSVELVGYSGGGAVAALVAARRSDVARLLTVAGNLHTSAWTAGQRLKPLVGSLNPADAWQALAAIAQRHYAGGEDAVMPPRVARAYAGRFPAQQRPQVVVVPGFDHRCCWVHAWPRLVGGPAAAD
ncbi:alpha/beta hydrolase [Orrella sp. JC864]|uniref:alpha/beta hydrolase n=1 Tax=Orrella sp. JC864 TaxID=3120298 RepID=UPI00300ACF87